MKLFKSPFVEDLDLPDVYQSAHWLSLLTQKQNHVCTKVTSQIPI